MTNWASVTVDVALNIGWLVDRRRIEGDVVSFTGRCAHVTFAVNPCWVMVNDTGNPLPVGWLGKRSISVLTGRLLPVAERSMLYIAPKLVGSIPSRYNKNGGFYLWVLGERTCGIDIGDLVEVEDTWKRKSGAHGCRATCLYQGYDARK